MDTYWHDKIRLDNYCIIMEYGNQSIINWLQYNSNVVVHVR